MSDTEAGRPLNGITLEYELEAPPEKVWRAISIPALRERWLPAADLVDPEPLAAAPGEAVRYRMRGPAPPFLESTVTIEVRPGVDGGSRLRIVHDLTDERLHRPATVPANANRPPLMRAA